MCGSGKRRAVNVSASWMTRPCPQQRYCCPAACFLVKVVGQMFLVSISAINYLHWRCAAKSSLNQSWLSGFRTGLIARGGNIKDGEKENVCCNNILNPFSSRLIQVNKPSMVARETKISSKIAQDSASNSWAILNSAAVLLRRIIRINVGIWPSVWELTTSCWKHSSPVASYSMEKGHHQSQTQEEVPLS